MGVHHVCCPWCRLVTILDDRLQVVLPEQPTTCTIGELVGLSCTRPMCEFHERAGGLQALRVELVAGAATGSIAADAVMVLGREAKRTWQECKPSSLVCDASPLFSKAQYVMLASLYGMDAASLPGATRADKATSQVQQSSSRPSLHEWLVLPQHGAAADAAAALARQRSASGSAPVAPRAAVDVVLGANCGSTCSQGNQGDRGDQTRAGQSGTEPGGAALACVSRGGGSTETPSPVRRGSQNSSSGGSTAVGQGSRPYPLRAREPVGVTEAAGMSEAAAGGGDSRVSSRDAESSSQAVDAHVERVDTAAAAVVCDIARSEGADGGGSNVGSHSGSTKWSTEADHGPEGATGSVLVEGSPAALVEAAGVSAHHSQQGLPVLSDDDSSAARAVQSAAVPAALSPPMGLCEERGVGRPGQQPFDAPPVKTGGGSPSAGPTASSGALGPERSGHDGRGGSGDGGDEGDGIRSDGFGACALLRTAFSALREARQREARMDSVEWGWTYGRRGALRGARACDATDGLICHGLLASEARRRLKRRRHEAAPLASLQARIGREALALSARLVALLNPPSALDVHAPASAHQPSSAATAGARAPTCPMLSDAEGLSPPGGWCDLRAWAPSNADAEAHDRSGSSEEPSELIAKLKLWRALALEIAAHHAALHHHADI